MAAINVCKLQATKTSIGYSSISPIDCKHSSPRSFGQQILSWERHQWRGSTTPISISRATTASPTKIMKAGVVVECKAPSVGETDFQEEVLNSDLPVLVDFIAPWCGPCKLIAPIIDWASEEYDGKLKVFKIDHDSNPQLVTEYKVYGLPTLIVFKDGKEVSGSRREGAITKDKLKAYLDQLIESVATI